MKNLTNETLPVFGICKLLVPLIVFVLGAAPVAASADKMPGYEKYREGHQGYLGDGILKQGEDESAELARAAQNPVADLISLPFQNNTNFNFGPREKTQNVLNIQPVIPVDLGEDWLMITRSIVPIISQPPFTQDDDREFGLGDSLFSAFFSPKNRDWWLGNWLWGVGPAVLVPTRTNDRLGLGEWGAGPTAVFLAMPGRWVIGSFFNNVWSFNENHEGNKVNLFTWQYFINYNFDDGWYLTSSPIVTANWEEDGDNTWTIPFGGGGGRVFRIGKQPVNCSLLGFYNVEKPDDIGPDWTIRFQFQLLFPKGRN